MNWQKLLLLGTMFKFGLESRNDWEGEKRKRREGRGRIKREQIGGAIMGFDGRWVRTATRTRTAAAVARSSSKWNRQRPRVWSGTRIASGASSAASSLTWTITRATRARFTVSHTSRNSSNRNRLRSPTSLVSRSHPTVHAHSPRDSSQL